MQLFCLRKNPKPEAAVASSVTGKIVFFCILGLFVEIVALKCDLFHHTMYRGIYSFVIIRLVRVSPFNYQWIEAKSSVKLERIRHTIYERKFFLVPQYIFAGRQINRSSVHDGLQNVTIIVMFFCFPGAPQERTKMEPDSTYYK